MAGSPQARASGDSTKSSGWALARARAWSWPTTVPAAAVTQATTLTRRAVEDVIFMALSLLEVTTSASDGR